MFSETERELLNRGRAVGVAGRASLTAPARGRRCSTCRAGTTCRCSAGRSLEVKGDVVWTITNFMNLCPMGEIQHLRIHYSNDGRKQACPNFSRSITSSTTVLLPLGE